MIKHIVIFRFKGDAEERLETAKEFKSRLDALPAVIPQLLAIETGINCNEHEDNDLVLTALAESLDDVAAYSAHPAHMAAVESVKSRIASRACVDYEF